MIPIIPTPGRLVQEDQKYEASLGYIVETLSQKQTNKKPNSDEGHNLPDNNT
jgi:hypothetical protein